MNELTGLDRTKYFLLNPAKEGRASSIESNGACVSEGVKRATSNSLTERINGNISESTALASNDPLSPGGYTLAQWTPNRVWLFNFNWFEAVEGACCLLLAASEHVKSEDEALGVVNSAVLLAHSHILWLFHLSVGRADALKAVKGTWCLCFNATLEVTSLNQTFTEVDSTVLFAIPNLPSGHFNFKFGFFHSLDAVKCTCSLSLCARVDIKRSDQALAIVNAAVLLTDAHFLAHMYFLMFFGVFCL
jgi:hypothetical protein